MEEGMSNEHSVGLLCGFQGLEKYSVNSSLLLGDFASRFSFSKKCSGQLFTTAIQEKLRDESILVNMASRKTMHKIAFA